MGPGFSNAALGAGEEGFAWVLNILRETRENLLASVSVFVVPPSLVELLAPALVVSVNEISVECAQISFRRTSPALHDRCLNRPVSQHLAVARKCQP